MRRVEFINQDASNPNLSEEDRRTIRRVSRRVGAASRRQQGAAPRINTLQVPDFLLEQIQRPAQLSPPLPVSPNGRQIPPELSVLLQPDLTGIILRYAAANNADADPRRWIKVCRLANDSLIHTLPRIYGYSKCLDDGIHCVITRVRWSFLQQTEGQPVESGELQIARAYDRAIRSLADSISSGAVDWTGWYATLLMALFELLDFNDHHGWIMHSFGAFIVLEALGPCNITTEIEKDVLIAQVELMVLEAFFKNISVYLDQPEWQRAIRSTIIPESELGDRSEAVVTWLVISTSAPGLFKRATETIMNQQYRQREEVLDELHLLLDNYERWYAEWASELQVPQDPELHNLLHDDLVLLRKVQVLTRYLSYLSLTQRFICAMEPDPASNAELEASTAASQVIRLAESLRSDSVPKLRISNALRIARSIQGTTQQWSSPEVRSSSPATIAPQIFSAWCSILDRPTG